MRSHPKNKNKKAILHYVQRAVHSLLSAIAGWLATGLVVLLFGRLSGDPFSTTLTILIIALQVVLLGWLFVGLPIAIKFKAQALRNLDDVIARYVVATTASFTLLTLVLIVIFIMRAPEFILITIFFFLPLLLWAAAVGFVGGAVFWALQRRFSRG